MDWRSPSSLMLCFLGRFDQRRQSSERFSFREEGMLEGCVRHGDEGKGVGGRVRNVTCLEQSLSIWPLFSIDFETLGEVIFEDFTECFGVINSRSAIGRD